jgi:hypothetical protein
VLREASIDCQLERKLSAPGAEDEKEFAEGAPAHPAPWDLAAMFAGTRLWPCSGCPPVTISIPAATLMAGVKADAVPKEAGAG